MAYDESDYEREDAETLKARRAALRAFAQGVAEAVQSLQLPETYLEAERAVRSVTVADRLIVRVRDVTLGEEGEVSYPSTAENGGPPPQQAGAEKEESEDKTPTTIASDGPPPHEWGGIKAAEAPLARDPLRLRLRAYADRVMEAATFIPKPDSFLEGERAGRYALACERMLTQLYAPPQLYTPPKAKAPRFDMDDDFEDGEADDGRKIFKPRNKGFDPTDCRANWADWQFELEEKLLKQTEHHHRRAEQTGFWSDGRPYVPALPPEEPVRYNPDGSVVQTYEALQRSIARNEAAQEAANKAHGWTPPDPP